MLDIPDFDHLKEVDDAAAKIQKARRSVEALRRLVLEHDSSFSTKSSTKMKAAPKSVAASEAFHVEIAKLRDRFAGLVATNDHQKRGFLFESFLADLFAIHDLNPRGSFRITGEQIDGAFEFDGTQFLLEAKWEKHAQGASPVDSFSKKVERKLDNTLGLFISLEGFTPEGLAAIRGNRPNTVLMDGQHLAVVLQGLIDFRKLLKQMVRHAAHTGDPYLSVHESAAG